MTVKELKEKLATYDDDCLVVMSRDSEGNSYSPIANIDGGLYVADTTWSGTFCEPHETVPGVCCVGFWPVC